MENKGNGENQANDLPQAESKSVEQDQNKKEINKQAVTVGVDSEGFFVVKVHTTQNPFLIIGVLEDAKAQYRGILMQAQKRVEELKNPGQKYRGFRPSTIDFLNKLRGRG